MSGRRRSDEYGSDGGDTDGSVEYVDLHQLHFKVPSDPLDTPTTERPDDRAPLGDELDVCEPACLAYPFVQCASAFCFTGLVISFFIACGID